MKVWALLIVLVLGIALVPAEGYTFQGSASPKHRHSYERWLQYLQYQEDQNRPEQDRTVGVKCAWEVKGVCKTPPNGQKYVHCKGSVKIPSHKKGTCTFIEYLEHLSGNKNDANGNYLGNKKSFSNIKVFPGKDDILIDEFKTIGKSYTTQVAGNKKKLVSPIDFFPEHWAAQKDGADIKDANGKTTTGGHVSNIVKAADAVGQARAGMSTGDIAAQKDLLEATDANFQRVRDLREADSYGFLKRQFRKKGIKAAVVERFLPGVATSVLDYQESLKVMDAEEEKKFKAAIKKETSGKAHKMHKDVNNAYQVAEANLGNVCHYPQPQKL